MDIWNNFNCILSAVQYDGELSATAYILLAGMLLLLCGGFGWCFYRAINAANSDEEQLPDEE